MSHLTFSRGTRNSMILGIIQNAFVESCVVCLKSQVFPPQKGYHEVKDQA